MDGRALLLAARQGQAQGTGAGGQEEPPEGQAEEGARAQDGAAVSGVDEGNEDLGVSSVQQLDVQVCPSSS